mgnify:CR=1 FL=1
MLQYCTFIGKPIHAVSTLLRFLPPSAERQTFLSGSQCCTIALIQGYTGICSITIELPYIFPPEPYGFVRFPPKHTKSASEHLIPPSALFIKSSTAKYIKSLPVRFAAPDQPEKSRCANNHRQSRACRRRKPHGKKRIRKML